MQIIHISAECYPIAKVGGLADVVGSLPKYQNDLGVQSSVIMPFYNNAFTKKNTFETVYEGSFNLGRPFNFKIQSLKNNSLGFELFLVDVPEFLFTDYVYSDYDTERFLAFQIAALQWITQLKKKPSIIHCHDHHTGLIPFMMSYSEDFKALKAIPSILTIHNAQYQGWFSRDLLYLLPRFNLRYLGMLDWYDIVNPLAAAIKCAWRVTTVSPSYMQELKQKANGLEGLLQQESAKCIGILNGIDTEVWNPETDEFIVKNYSEKTLLSGKKANKQFLCKEFNLDATKPLFAFVGRLVGEKGADLFPGIFNAALNTNNISILLLGSGQKDVENQLNSLKDKYPGTYNNFIGYDEKLSHIIYAGADFLLMPSRVEPCGLNQMYALRYGTIPVVNSVGGLIDTVVDIGDGGFGIRHPYVSIEEVYIAIQRATELFSNQNEFKKIRKQIMSIDHSWVASAKAYNKLYKSLN